MVFWIQIQIWSILSGIISFPKYLFIIPAPPHFFKWRAHVTRCLASFIWRHCSAISRNPNIKQFQVIQWKVLLPPEEINDTYMELQMNINIYNGLTILGFEIWLRYMINMECITHKVLHQIYGLFFSFTINFTARFRLIYLSICCFQVSKFR